MSTLRSYFADPENCPMPDLREPDNLRTFTDLLRSEFQFDERTINLFAAFLITVKTRDTELDMIDYCDQALGYLYAGTNHCDQAESKWLAEVRSRMTPAIRPNPREEVASALSETFSG